MSHSYTASEMAYAKINLALHVVARLPNGYHQLDSIAAFVGIGDVLDASVQMDGNLRLGIDGEFSEGLPTTDNLIIRAAQLLQTHAQIPMGAHIQLHKNIPVGAGLGGGSADAAATLRLLNRVWNLRYSTAMLAELGEQLGADVPACVFSQATRMEGVGEELTPLPHAPLLSLVLVYPHEPLWTPDIFGAMQGKAFSGRLSEVPTMGASTATWLEWLEQTTNDLQQISEKLNSHIAPMLQALRAQNGCRLARMSGSGSACFGVYDTIEQAELAAQKIQSAQPNWWVRASQTIQTM